MDGWMDLVLDVKLDKKKSPSTSTCIKCNVIMEPHRHKHTFLR